MMDASFPFEFVAFLKELGDHLTSDNVRDLKFLCSIPDGDAEKIDDGFSLLKWLRHQGKLTLGNLADLAYLLDLIYRKDLARKVKEHDSLQSQKLHSVSQWQDPPKEKTPPRTEKSKLLTPQSFTKKQGTGSAHRVPVEYSYATPGKTIQTPEENSSISRQNTATSGNEKLSQQAEPCEEDEGEDDATESRMVSLEPLVQGLITTNSTMVKHADSQPKLSNTSMSGLKVYPMKQDPRGLCVIISNRDFGKARLKEAFEFMEDRNGTEIDARNLIDTFKWLKFDVEEHIYTDLEGHEIWKTLLQYSRKDHSQYDCFASVILSHGSLTGVFGVDGKDIKFHQIFPLFNSTVCPTLAGKPKMFFIQACRGTREDPGNRIDSGKDIFSSYSVPEESDYFLGYATPPGYVCWRSESSGSWYISKLCEALRDYGLKYNIHDIMTVVNDEVSQAYTKEGYRQMPNPSHTLRKRLLFFPEEFEEQEPIMDINTGISILGNRLQDLAIG